MASGARTKARCWRRRRLARGMQGEKGERGRAPNKQRPPPGEGERECHATSIPGVKKNRSEEEHLTRRIFLLGHLTRKADCSAVSAAGPCTCFHQRAAWQTVLRAAPLTHALAFTSVQRGRRFCGMRRLPMHVLQQRAAWQTVLRAAPLTHALAFTSVQRGRRFCGMRQIGRAHV